MSHSALFERLARADTVVVTPNRRLARAMGLAFDAWQAGLGRRVWEGPRIVPLAAFEATLYEAAQHDPALAGVRAPLGAAQERALWEAVVDASGVALAAPARAAELAADAWRLAHQWRIADRLKPYALTEDTRLFVAWAADFERRVDRLGAIDTTRVPDALRALSDEARLAVRESIVLAGFDRLSPQHEALFTSLAARGTAIERRDDVRPPGEQHRVEASSLRDELARMADWVAARLSAAPEARIGIVVPDLGARGRAVVRALESALAPDALLAASDRPRPYTVSLGGALADAPLVATALGLLRLAVDELPFPEASALLRSPYVAFGPPPEVARFDMEWRRRAGRTTALDHWLTCLRAPHDEPSGLRAALEALDAWRQRAGALPRRPSEWPALLMNALRAVGFPGPTALDTNEHQTLARWRELLTEFASLERVQGPLEPRAAVSRLARLAASTVFQPEGGDPPVQVLGLLEATGLEFDHLWIAGMTSESWPPAARPHPFLPLELQRAHGMPGALVEQELERARSMLERLVRSASEVVASHGARDGERPLAPSPMIAHWPRADAIAVAPRAVDRLEAALETLADASAPPLADREVSGGVATLTDQAACPFRAFARHRLHADQPELPHDGLAASERGDLVHRVLAGFWDSLPARTRAHVVSMREDALEAAIGRAADKALARLRARRLDGPGDALLGLERRRLVSLVLRWLQFETQARGDFEVRSTEERRTLAIGRLALSGRLDRVDCLPDGRSIVIDYKTGGPASARAWLGERPDEPQLPLYLVASETDARAVAFARLRAGELRFVALAEDGTMLPNASVEWQDDRHRLWSELVDAWREELTRLADAFADGVAAVDPKRADSCRHCDVALLCRLDERIGERTAEAEFADEDADE